MKKKLSVFGIGLALAVSCCITSCAENQPAETDLDDCCQAEVQSDSTVVELNDSIPADTTVSEQE